MAADHYNEYKMDIALMKSMGLKHYRFSISWPRLIPTGKLKDGVNAEAKAFYNDLIDSLLEAGAVRDVVNFAPRPWREEPLSEGSE